MLVITAILYINENRIYYGALMQTNYSKKINKEIIEKFFIYLIIIIFAIFCAERNIKMSDAQPYIEYFDRLNISSFSAFFKIDGRYGIGYEFLNKIIKLIFGNNYKNFFAIVAVINCLLVYSATYKNNKISFLLYLSFFGIYYNFIVLRQGISMSFAILALVNLNKSALKSIFYIVIGSLFHETVLIVFMFFIVKFIRKGIKQRTYLIVLLISVVLYLTKLTTAIIQPLLLKFDFLIRLIPQFKHYVTNMEYFNDISILYLVYYATSILLVLKRKTNIIYNRLLFINVLGAFLLGVFSTLSVFVRIVDYAFLTYIFLIPMALREKPRLDHNIIEIGYFALTTLFYIRLIWYVVPFHF
jgi:hypothetical protein